MNLDSENLQFECKKKQKFLKMIWKANKTGYEGKTIHKSHELNYIKKKTKRVSRIWKYDCHNYTSDDLIFD